MQKQLIAVGVLFLTFPLHIWCTGGAVRNYEQWNIKGSFSDGIPSWQSYPLAQVIDIRVSITCNNVCHNDSYIYHRGFWTIGEAVR